jgi:hypothetical protein
MMRRARTRSMRRIAGRGGLPGPTRPTGRRSTPTVCLRDAQGSEAGTSAQAPPGLTGMVQRGNQNVPSRAFPTRRAIRSHSHAEMGTSSARISMRELEYSLTLSRLFRRSAFELSHRLDRESDRRLGATFQSCRQRGGGAQIIRFCCHTRAACLDRDLVVAACGRCVPLPMPHVDGAGLAFLVLQLRPGRPRVAQGMAPATRPQDR